jgi:beta-barrel assembly-enhancing protease
VLGRTVRSQELTLLASEKDEVRMEWLFTHPMSAARAERLKAELAALPKKSPEPFTFDWKQVQASLGS